MVDSNQVQSLVASQIVRGLALALHVGFVSAAEDIRGIPSVIDGDTLGIHGQRIRLHGIDAPESSQTCERGEDKWRCGHAAALALADAVAEKTVRCVPVATDRYGRVVAECFMGQASINAWLVGRGWALDWPKYSDGAYAAQQQAAEAAGRGIWQSKFVPPWEWRRGGRRSAGTD